MTDTIAIVAVDTDSFAAPERPAVYDAAIDATLATRFLTEPVRARIESCHLGPLRVIACAASPRRSERTIARIARDRFDGIGLQLAVHGAAHGDANGRRIESRPGTITILDFGQPFVVVDDEPRTVITVSIPRPVLARRIADLRALHGLVLDREASAMLAAHLETLAPRLGRMPLGGAAVLGDIVIQLFLLALGHHPGGDAGGYPGGAPVPPLDRRRALFARARHLIDGRLGSGKLTPEWLVTTLNVSRSELYHAFEEHGGVARFVWRLRLDAARAALIDPHDTRRIGAIAFAHGFASEAHFARAYRQAFGKTASESRRDGA